MHNKTFETAVEKLKPTFSGVFNCILESGNQLPFTEYDFGPAKTDSMSVSLFYKGKYYAYVDMRSVAAITVNFDED